MVLIALAGMFFVSLLVIVIFIAIYNKIIRKKQLVQEAWSGIDVQLKRRHDIIPNLVEVVKGYVKHEQQVLEEVTRLRSITSSPQGVKDQADKENFLTKGLRSVFALAEAYPDLKANTQFLDLHKNLNEIEDELQMARRYYNGTVRDYNVLIKVFPNNLIAQMFNFQEEDFFEIEVVTDRENPAIKF